MNQWTLTSQERDSLLAFLRKLVQTRSLPGREGAAAALVLAEMQQLGFPEVWMDAAGNVLARISASPARNAGDGKTLMFNSHVDTVEVSDRAGWSLDPWAAEVRGGQLYGLGACDMKGGLAATLYGVAHLLRLGAPLNGDILIAVVGLEEPSEGTCTRALFEEDGLAADWVVIAEPSNLQVVRAQRGHIELQLTVKGRSAHSAAPELGDNAVYAASRLIFGLEILAEQLASDPFLGPGVLAVTDIRSQAVSRNAIPERCDIIVDRRLTVGETEALALAEVQRIIVREGVDARVQVIEETVQTHTGRAYRARRASPPWAFDERHPLIAATVQAARELGLRPALEKWNFATEGAYTAGVRQIPTVGFGPGNPELAHTCDEHIELEQIYTAASVYAALAARLLK